MGCFWSSQGSHDRCMHCGRRAVNNLRIVDHVCECCISQTTRREAIRSSSVQIAGPCFGEYRCSCGRFWQSARSWPGNYQICKRCRKHVYAHIQRELRPSDRTDSKENHKKELCQKCMQLGYDCSRFQSTTNSRNPKKSLARSYPNRTRTNYNYKSPAKSNRKW